MANKIQIIGGHFQDSKGNPLSHGQVIFKLEQDEHISSGGQVSSGIKVTVNLDAQGDAFGTNIISIANTSVLENVLTVVFGSSVISQVSIGDVLVFPAVLNSTWLQNQSVTVSTISSDGLSITATVNHSDYTSVSELGFSLTVGLPILIWPNDLLTPGTFYIVNAYSQRGQISWGPFYGTVDSPSPFNMNTWIPSKLG